MMNPFIQKALSTIRRFPPKEVIFKSKVEDAERAQWHIARDAKTGSIMTNDRLRVLIDAEGPNGKMLAHLRDVFAIGDCAVIQNTKYPATAQVASQKALWLAQRLNNQDLHTKRFTFKNLGIMAYIGNWKAIFEGGHGIGNISGRTAWILWRVSNSRPLFHGENLLTLKGCLSSKIYQLEESHTHSNLLVSAHISKLD
jgi:NADH dehydrogenase